MEVPGSDKDIVLSRSDAESILGGRMPTKGGLLRRLLSLGAALFVRFFYNPSLLRKLLRFPFPFRKRVAILGGGFAGVELGETLAENGKQVAIVEPSKRIGNDIDIIHRWVFLKNLKEAGAELLTQAQVVEITDKGVKVIREGSSRFIEADTVVPINITTNRELADTFEGKVSRVFVVGDCGEPAKLQEAITAGFIAGQEI
jgi:2,4-dienoyl-CoA reductase (NADPH2)